MPPLITGRKIAEKVVEQLSRFCDRIDVAGSVRRGRPFVNDVDVAVLPKLGQEYPMRARAKERSHVVREGDRLLEVRLANGVQVDLWIALPGIEEMFTKTATNYGAVLLTYTGSKEHNIYLVEHAKTLGLTYKPGHGVYQGEQCIASATEAEIFASLKLPFLKPEERER